MAQAVEAPSALDGMADDESPQKLFRKRPFLGQLLLQSTCSSSARLKRMRASNDQRKVQRTLLPVSKWPFPPRVGTT